jgi:hypothetical protein
MKQITGQFIYPNGQPAAGAVLTLLLSQDANQAGTGQIMHVPVVITLDQSGNIPSGTEIMANDEITPNATFYIVTVKDPVYGEVYFEALTISGTSPININTLTPCQRPA